MPTSRSSTRARPTPGARQSHPIEQAKALRAFHPNGGKRYQSLNPATLAEFPFEIEVYRNGMAEVHGFIARPIMDFGSAMLVLKGSEDDQGAALLRVMRVNLADDDGVSNDWAPVMTSRPAKAPPTWVPKFRAPAPPHGDGQLHTMDRIAEWTDRDKGSSRRRWNYLMFEDDGVSVSFDVVLDLLKDITEAAAGIPTDGS